MEDSYLSPHLTVVPEKQAEYINGKQNLMNYLKDKSLEARANVQVDKLQPAKLYFTVTKTGTIENVTLDRSSNYLEVDKKMIELLKENGALEKEELIIAKVRWAKEEEERLKNKKDDDRPTTSEQRRKEQNKIRIL